MPSDLQAALNEREWRRCFPQTDDVEALFEAFVYFATTYWYIRHPKKGSMLFELREAQRDVVRDWLTERNCIAPKARQIGFSTLAACFAFWETWGYGDRFEVLLSKGEREAIKLLQKTKYGFKRLPEWMKRRGPRQTEDTLTKMGFANDSAIESLPSKNDPARGESVYRVWVDEWAFLDNAEEAWASIEPITDIGGRVVGISTANGWGTFFHEMWVEATTGVSNFKPFFRSWRAVDERDDEWYEKQKAKFRRRPWILHQEYPNTPEEAFIKSGNTVFDSDRLQEMRASQTAQPKPMQIHLLRKERWKVYDAPEGELHVYKPPQKGQVYVIGADVAEGLEHGDFSAAHVLRAGKNVEQVAVWHGHIDADVYGSVLAALGWWYNTALIEPELNNHGLTTIKALQRAKYPNIYRTERIINRKQPKIEQYGFRTTSSSKPFVINQLNALIRDRGITIHDDQTYAELLTFVRDERGKMGGSPYDDRTMALALAADALNHAYLPEYVKGGAPEGSAIWWEKLWDKAEAMIGGGDKQAIGSFNVR